LIRLPGFVILLFLRTLAIDLGSRRVGLALSDEGGRFATPYEVLLVTSPEQTTELVVKVIEKEGAERLVVGLPLNMDGSSGPAARSAVEWGRSLAERSGKPVIFVDERLSSFDAEQQLIDRKRAGEKLTRQRKKEQLDAIAAAAFLQDFLDGKLDSIDA
jgi:putative Holliday junction resolvase